MNNGNLFRQVEEGDGMLGTPSLYPSIFANNQSGRNDHKVSPVEELVH